MYAFVFMLVLLFVSLIASVAYLARQLWKYSKDLRWEIWENYETETRLAQVRIAYDKQLTKLQTLLDAAEEASARRGERIAELEAANEKLITERAKIRQAVGVDLPGIDVPEGPKFAVGDKAVIVGGYEDYHYFDVGTTVTITNNELTDDDGSIIYGCCDGRVGQVVKLEHLEPAPSEVSK